MATWNDLRQYIFSNYQVTQEAPGVIRLIFNLGNGRTQNVLVSGKQAGAFEYFVIWTPICHESQISARDAMVRNATMSIGALGLVPDGTVILRWSAPLKDLDPDEFDVPLQGLAIAGDMLEQEFSGADRY
jgi:hypothetical protein